MTKRRKSRELALQVLYANTYDQEPVEDVLQKILDTHECSADIVPFAREIINAVEDHREEFDQLIVNTAFNWDISRIAQLDKIVIRMALAEIFYFDTIPYKVSIDEAIELGKKFSSKDSGKFINGILDAIGKDRKQEKP